MTGHDCQRLALCRDHPRPRVLWARYVHRHVIVLPGSEAALGVYYRHLEDAAESARLFTRDRP